MLKKIALTLVTLLSTILLEAKTVPLDTGRWVIDTYRNVEIDQFDYLYTINQIDFYKGVIELEDGSLWAVKPLEAESQSFYAQKNIGVSSSSHLDLLGSFEPNDSLIFHKVVNRDSVLAYNINKDMILDVTPISAPNSPMLTIAAIKNTNITTYHYIWDPDKSKFKEYSRNHWITVIKLSDNSIWQIKDSTPPINWLVNDPVHIAKDTPWWSSNTHILLLMKPIRSGPNVAPKFERLGVWRSS